MCVYVYLCVCVCVLSGLCMQVHVQYVSESGVTPKPKSRMVAAGGSFAEEFTFAEAALEEDKRKIIAENTAARAGVPDSPFNLRDIALHSFILSQLR